MSLQPFVDAGAVISWHTALALFALVAGTVQLVRRKGSRAHRAIGWAWVIAMAVTAVLSFRISTICLLGPFSPIHLLSIVVLVFLPLAIWHARAHRVTAHRYIMVFLFVGGLLIAGGFTLVPGRVMHDAVFGTTTNDSNSCEAGAP